MTANTQNKPATADAMQALMAELFPICRSITGDGVRRSLSLLADVIPLQIHEVPSGTAVFDWTVPNEWNVNEAWVKDPTGQKIIDFGEHNLHLMSYSEPLRETMPLDALKPHLYSLPEQPDLIPYRTSYYARDWGFCLPHKQLELLPDGDYDVFIDSTLEPGGLSYGEYLIPGEIEKEVLVFSHVCHPSLANDNLSGLVVNSFLAQRLADADNYYTYRFVFAPGAIGSITWLAMNEDMLRRVHCGLVSVLLGGDNRFTYKKSRAGNAEIDTVVPFVLEENQQPHDVIDFEPYGYDERQFGSPGIALNVGRLTRAPNNEFPEYHSSADNLAFVSKESLAESLAALWRISQVLDANRTYNNLNPKCEPQLGRRGLYGSVGGEHIKSQEHAMLWLLNQSDGQNSILDIAKTSGLPFDTLAEAAGRLVDAELLATADNV